MIANYIIAIEYETHCDILRIPVAAYPAVCFGLNQQRCRYWILHEEYAGHEYNGATYLQIG